MNQPIEFRVLVHPSNPDWSGPCQVALGLPNGVDVPFAAKLVAAEYLAYIVATESGAGFERALELVVEGAMTWRHKLRPGGSDAGA